MNRKKAVILWILRFWYYSVVIIESVTSLWLDLSVCLLVGLLVCLQGCAGVCPNRCGAEDKVWY